MLQPNDENRPACVNQGKLNIGDQPLDPALRASALSPLKPSNKANIMPSPLSKTLNVSEFIFFVFYIVLVVVLNY